MAAARASVIVRCKDEAATLGRTLDLLHGQTVRPEIVVIDSGSTDGSLEIARRRADRLVEIAPGDFSYGGALNLGSRVAAAPIHFALSAHCFPGRDWVERSLAHFDDARVAATNGIQTFSDGRAVEGVFLQDWAHASLDPDWGFSNHASAWRAAVVERFPFDETMDYAEDREWSWRVMRAGWLIAFDPMLWVDLSHSWKGAKNVFQRRRRAVRALRSFADMPDYGIGDLVVEWWADTPADGRSPAFHRLNYRRLAGLAGKWLGRRQAVAVSRRA